MSDCTEQLQHSINDALQQNHSICIRGSGSKDFYGGEINGIALSTKNHKGIINYEPKELVITARSGTSLLEIETTLANEGQMLAFEPPYFAADATLGGTIACGFSGPRRPYAGAARDFVLGTRIINGHAEVLRFGGEVMKNVAGYDVSRLMVGALGTLGLILDVSLKVLPLPEQEITMMLECTIDDAIRLMNEWAGSPLPLSAACYDGAHLYIRLSGTPTAVIAGSQRIGGEQIQDSQAFWKSIRELEHGFFNRNETLWRFSMPSTTPYFDLPGKQLIDWGGAQRWYIPDSNHDTEKRSALNQSIEALGGHATLFYTNDSHSEERFHPLTPALFALQRKLKHSFDPQGVFNPGRLYRDL